MSMLQCQNYGDADGKVLRILEAVGMRNFLPIRLAGCYAIISGGNADVLS